MLRGVNLANLANDNNTPTHAHTLSDAGVRCRPSQCNKSQPHREGDRTRHKLLQNPGRTPGYPLEVGRQAELMGIITACGWSGMNLNGLSGDGWCVMRWGRLGDIPRDKRRTGLGEHVRDGSGLTRTLSASTTERDLRPSKDLRCDCGESSS